MKGLKSLFALYFITVLFFACDPDKEYFKHDLDYEKIGECRDITSKVNIVANTIGERYEFQECLASGYDGSYTAERKGDTVVVRLNTSTGGASSLFKIMLDINTKPGYTYLSINGSTMQVNVKR